MHLEPWCGGWNGGTESSFGKWEIKAKNRSGASSSNNRFEIAARIGHPCRTNLVLSVTRVFITCHSCVFVPPHLEMEKAFVR
jgi:hypothetical protein